MKHISIVDEGRLTVPLFHGTSSLHVDSIRMAGLGSRNIIEEMGIRRAAQLLLTMVNDFRDQDGWLDPIDACTRIARDPAEDRLIDPGTGLCWNFRYGGTYLTPSRETAANYAILYPQGGEALTHIIKLYRKVVEIKPELNENPSLSPLIHFARAPGGAVVVEARRVPVSMLRAEQGGGTDYVIARIEDALENPEVYDWLAGQDNFELLGTVPLADLRFYSAKKVTEYDENGASRQTLELTEFR